MCRSGDRRSDPLVTSSAPIIDAALGGRQFIIGGEGRVLGESGGD